MTSRQLRLLRAAAATSAATILAAVSHTVGGGMPPHPLLVAALSILLVPLAALLIGRRLSATRTALTVLVAQLVFHVLFQVLAGSLTDAAPVGSHAHHVVTLGSTVSAVAPDAPMLVSHLLAALATTMLLWHGERMLRSIAGWARARLLPVLPVLPVRPRLRLIPTGVSVTTSLTPLGTTVTRRGPPSV